uniref:Uncharacterized protein n=1 Tax=Anguilla anguilla TaxID=7936 RepID=A0A0E9QPI7_ANGAN
MVCFWHCQTVKHTKGYFSNTAHLTVRQFFRHRKPTFAVMLALDVYILQCFSFSPYVLNGKGGGMCQ